MTVDSFYNPLISKLQGELVKYWIGQRLGACPVTQEYSLDARTSLQIWTADPRGNTEADLIIVVSPAGLAGLDLEQVKARGFVVIDPAHHTDGSKCRGSRCPARHSNLKEI